MATTKIIINNSDAAAAVTRGCITNEQATYIGQLINSGVDMSAFFLSDSGQGLGNGYENSPPQYNNLGMVTNPGTHFTGADNICLGAKWFKDNNIDLTTTLINRLRSVGISITTGTAQTTVVAPGTAFSSLVDACRAAITTGTGISAAFTNMSNSLDYGYIQAQINEFMSDTSNESAIKQAIQYLNYPIPITSDIDGENQFEQIYWGAYYLTEFPFQASYSSSDCETIVQAIKDLTAEKANIAQAIATSFYSLYTQDDYEIKNVVLTDMISKYNILDAKYNCTASIAKQINQQANAALQSGTSGGTTKPDNTIWYVILGASVLILSVVVIKKMKKKGGAPSTASAPIAENKAAA